MLFNVLRMMGGDNKRELTEEDHPSPALAVWTGELLEFSYGTKRNGTIIIAITLGDICQRSRERTLRSSLFRSSNAEMLEGYSHMLLFPRILPFPSPVLLFIREERYCVCYVNCYFLNRMDEDKKLDAQACASSYSACVPKLFCLVVCSRCFFEVFSECRGDSCRT